MSKTYEIVCSFLGVPDDPVKSIQVKQRNKTRVSSAVRTLNSHFDRSSYASLIELIGTDVGMLKNHFGCNVDKWDLSESHWCRLD